MISGKTNSIIFLGTGPVAAASLEFIVKYFSIEAVITKPRAPHHKGSAPVEELATSLDLPLHFVANKKELDDLTTRAQFASQAGLVVDFGIIISQQVINSFEKGIINSHFSLLPEWRGADPISYTILSGQSKTGVSLMLIEPTLDTGKLITQRSIAVDAKDTTGTLTDKLIKFSNELLLEYLPAYLDGKIKPKNQPHPDRATFSHKLSKSDAQINWQEGASVIERKIRAYQPWPKARAMIGSIECIIIDADVVPSMGRPAGTLSLIPPAQLVIACGEDALAINTLQPLGKKEMPVKAFLAGYKSHLEA